MLPEKHVSVHKLKTALTCSLFQIWTGFSFGHWFWVVIYIWGITVSGYDLTVRVHILQSLWELWHIVLRRVWLQSWLYFTSISSVLFRSDLTFDNAIAGNSNQLLLLPNQFYIPPLDSFLFRSVFSYEAAPGECCYFEGNHMLAPVNSNHERKANKKDCNYEEFELWGVLQNSVNGLLRINENHLMPHQQMVKMTAEWSQTHWKL